MDVAFGKQQLISWLDDAHAMETGLVSILQNHASHLDSGFPDAAARVRRHIEETRTHAVRVQQCLSLLGSTPSSVKSTLSSLIGVVEGASTVMFRDHVVKDVLADYASEQFEVGCYAALVSVASALGHDEVARLCQQNLDEDLEMGTWLLERIPAVAKADVARGVIVETLRGTDS